MSASSAPFRPGTDYPGSIYPTVETESEQLGALVGDGPGLAAWVGPFLREERGDVLRKLAASGLDERHAFVIVPALTHAPYSVVAPLLMSSPALPTADPDLPDEITHVWVAGMWSIGRGYRWSTSEGWATFATNDPG